MLELLSVDNKTRIKIKDILVHPWVKQFEKEELDKLSAEERAQYINSSEAENPSCKDIENLDKYESENTKKGDDCDVIVRVERKISSSTKKLLQFKSKENFETFKEHNDLKNLEEITSPDKSFRRDKASKRDLDEIKILESANNQNDQYQSLLNNNLLNLNDKDYNLLHSQAKEESLFDKVLSQVQSKKKIKVNHKYKTDLFYSSNDYNTISNSIKTMELIGTNEEGFDFNSKYKDNTNDHYNSKTARNFKEKNKFEEDEESFIDQIDNLKKNSDKVPSQEKGKNTKQGYSPATFLQISKFYLKCIRF